MRNSNKVLLIAAVAVLVFILTFVLVMGLKTRDLFEQHGRTARLESYRASASSTIDLSLSSTVLAGSCASASSRTASASW
jgi:hypothetical protein